MTSMLARLRDDALLARKAAAQGGDFKSKVTATLLVTLVSEAGMVGKNKGGRDSTDLEVVDVIGRFLSGATENHSLHMARAEPDATRIAELEIEKNILAGYMPEPLVQLTDAELASEVAAIIAGLPQRTMKQMGVVMGTLKKNFDGRYNGDAASKVVKAALA